MLELKTPYSDGTQALALTGIEFCEKLASIIPPPFRNIIRFWGCFAANSKIRRLIVPAPPKEGEEEQARTSSYIPWAELLRRVFRIDIETCRKCGGRMRLISAIIQGAVIEKILHHVGMSTDPPFVAPPPPGPVSDEEQYYQAEDVNQEVAW